MEIKKLNKLINKKGMEVTIANTRSIPGIVRGKKAWIQDCIEEGTRYIVEVAGGWQVTCNFEDLKI